jgi:hypothetical protein
MDKKIAGLIGAISAVVPLEAAHANAVAVPQPTEVLRAESFADLLEPIPNALALLRAADAQTGDLRAEAESPQNPNIKTAGYYHHHHHHHSYYRYYHHHHHHHNYYRYYHHHHQNYYWR